MTSPGKEHETEDQYHITREGDTAVDHICKEFRAFRWSESANAWKDASPTVTYLYAHAYSAWRRASKKPMTSEKKYRVLRILQRYKDDSIIEGVTKLVKKVKHATWGLWSGGKLDNQSRNIITFVLYSSEVRDGSNTSELPNFYVAVYRPPVKKPQIVQIAGICLRDHDTEAMEHLK